MTLITPSAGHVPGLPTLSRRSLLCAAPVALAPAILAGPALASSSATPIQRLFRDWYDAQAAFIATDEDLDWTTDEHCIAMSSALEKLQVEPITCIEDLALKTMALSWLGDFALTREGVEECKAFLAREMA